MLTNLDLFALGAGQFKPFTFVFTNIVTDAQLHIEFSPVIDNPRASGIQVRRIGSADTDSDGLGDKTERDAGTNPKMVDTDGDGLGDAAEVDRQTDPLKADTDGGGVSDGVEVAVGTDPLRATDDADPVSFRSLSTLLLFILMILGVITVVLQAVSLTRRKRVRQERPPEVEMPPPPTSE